MNKGFTLLEALFGLIMLSLISMLILQLMLVISKSQYDHYNQRQEVLFLMQIQRDMILTVDTDVKDSKLSLEKVNGDIISYKQSKNNIIRQVNNKGGEIVMSNVDGVLFVTKKNVIYLEVAFNDKKDTLTIGNEK